MRKALSPALIKTVVDNAAALATTHLGCQFISEVLISGDGDKTAALEAVASLAEESDGENKDTGRLFKTLVQEGFFHNKDKTLHCKSPPIVLYFNGFINMF